jgi:hypothetical protein
MQQPTISDIERANTRYLYLDMAWMGVAFAMEWYFLQVFAIRLNATPAHLAALTSLRALLQVVGSGLCTWWLTRFPNPVASLRLPALVYRIILYLLMVFVPILPFPDHQVDALVALAVLCAIPTGITQGVFLSVLRQSVSERQLAKVVARRQILMSGAILVCVIGFGQLLERLPFPINYQIGFGIAFAASIGSWASIQRIKVLPSAHAEAKPQTSVNVNVWKHRGYVRFAIVVFAVCVFVFMAGPLGQLHLVRNLNASDTWISVFGLFETGAGTLIMLFMDRLLARFSTVRLFTMMAFATILQPLILGLTPTLPPFIAGQIAFGAGWYAANVLMFGLLVEIVPQEGFSHYANSYTVLINVAMFIGPLIGTFMIEHGLTLPVALFVIAAGRLGAAMLTWLIPKSKAIPAVSVSEVASAV